MVQTSTPTTRRVVVLGLGAGLLSACSGDDEGDAEEERRRRRRRQKAERQRAGTVLTQQDLDHVAGRLTELIDGGDVAAFLDYARPSDSQMWQQMWQGLHTVPTTDRQVLLQSVDPRWRNRKGGPVTAVARAVVAYRIEGCDAEPMAHLCDLSIVKSPKGRVRVQTLGPLRDPGAAPWLLSPVAVVTSPHVVLISRAQDAATAEGLLADVERGAARAMDLIAPPSGVEQICMTLGWDGAERTLYGGSDGDFIGSAHDYRYVDPQQLADTGRRSGDETFEGSRVVVAPAAVMAQGAEAVAAHESVHALAFQWGRSAPPLYAEGLARYFEAGAAATTRAARGVGSAGYRQFAQRMSARPGRAGFYEATWSEVNYTCAAMMCAHVAREHGRSSMLALVRAAYEGDSDPARKVLGMSQSTLLREVAGWLEREETPRSSPSPGPTDSADEPDDSDAATPSAGGSGA